MEFLNPGMFFGFFALLIPVIIHLFNFRRYKTLYFSNIELLKTVQQQTSKTSSIKHLLVLISRLLLISFLVLAFARPFIPSKNQNISGNTSLVAVYLDNSRSMQAKGSESSIFEESKWLASDLISNTSKEKQFVISENNFLPSHSYPLSRQEALTSISQISAFGPHRTFISVIEHQKGLSVSELSENRVLYYFSDFQKSSFEKAENVSDTSLNLVLVRNSPSEKKNLYIDSCWFTTPVVQAGFPAILKVRIHNAGNEAIRSLPVRLFIGEEQKAIQNLDIDAEKSIETSLQFLLTESGSFQGKVTITDYPIVFDDEMFFSFSIAKNIRVLEITENDANPYLDAIFGNDSLFTFQVMHPARMDYQSINGFNFIIFNGLTKISDALQRSIMNYIRQGGNVLLIPGNSQSYVYQGITSNFGFRLNNSIDTVQTRVLNLDQNHAFWSDVFVKIPEKADFPVVYKHFSVQTEIESNAQILMQLLNNDPLLMVSSFEKGTIYTLTTPLDPKSTNLVQHNLFVPMIYKMCFSAKKGESLYEIIGKTDSYNVKTSMIDDVPFRILSSDQKIEFIPENRSNENGTKLLLHSSIQNPGQYILMRGDSLISTISFNENRNESMPEYLDDEQLMKVIQKNNFRSVNIIRNTHSEILDITSISENGFQLWKYCLILALIFMLFEVTIIRFWK
jgi:hypothetical protein